MSLYVYQDLSLTQWISHLPPELVAAHLKMDRKRVESLPKWKPVAVPV